MNAPRFASVFAEPAASPIRALFPYLSRPGMISFAGGYPSPALLDHEGLQQAMQQAWSTPAACMQYGATEGSPELRDALACLSRERGVDCEAAELLVTTGSQQAFDILVRILVEPGDPVLLEAPAYPAAIQALRLAQAQLVPVQTDADGLQPDAVERALHSLERKPKLLYTVATFSNPSGSTLALARREALVRIALAHGLLIVEDDPYGELAFTEEKMPSLYEVGRRLAGERNPVLYLSSLSKTVAPALRIGWMVAPASVLRRSAIAKQTMDLCTSPLIQLAAAHYLRSGRYRSALTTACTVYRCRMNAMSEEIEKRLPRRLRFVRPRGGLFMWAEWSGAPEPEPLFEAAVDEGVLFVPGAAFRTDGRPSLSLRLSFAAPDVPDIVEGVRRLAQAFDRATIKHSKEN